MEAKNKSLHEVLSYIQVHLVALKDKQANGGGTYNYRTCEGIIAAVKPFLEQFNLTLIFDDVYDVIPMQSDTTTKIIYHAKAVLSNGKDSITGTGFASVVQKLASMSEPQIWGATMSYARKYALGSLFAIDNEDTLSLDNVKLTPEQLAEMKENALMDLETLKTEADFQEWGVKYAKVKALPNIKPIALEKFKALKK